MTYMCACGRSSSCLCEIHALVPIVRETIAEAQEDDACGICISVDHFREDHPSGTEQPPDGTPRG